MYSDWLISFVKQSLEIESIFREPTEAELSATWNFIQLEKIRIIDLIDLVKVYEPTASIRSNSEMRVWIGGREALPGGEYLLNKLDELLYEINECHKIDPYEVHLEYEFLHPFIDGNGRSGRALWANMMFKQGYDFRNYLFLQMFYYQTLSAYSNKLPYKEGL